MRLVQLSLIGLGVLAALVLSVALVLRNLPADPAQAPEPAEQAAPEQAVPEKSATAAEPQEASREPDTASAAPSAAAELLPAPPASPPLVEPLVAKPAGSQGSAFDPLILPPSGLSGGTIAALPQSKQNTPQGSQPGAPAERTASLPAGARLRLSEAQQEKVRYVLQSHNIVQTEADFPLNPGTNVPQEVNLSPLPVELANVVPNYRAYSYVFAQDRILIVITNSREIGLILPL
jgi:hypothetical protein